MKKSLWLFLMVCASSCTSNPEKDKTAVPVVAFLDAFQDETIDQAKQGFFAALNKNGFSEDSGTIKVIYRNAQGDIPALTQSVDYFISEKVNLIATNATLATITAAQKTKNIPVCMMVAPAPKMAGLTDSAGKAPENLFGVYETLAYIDTSVSVIKQVLPNAKTIGTVFNQAEPQSQAALQEITNQCKLLGLTLIALPVNNSSETQLVLSSLLNKNIDAFFAMPDNTIFASFEIIAKSCDDKNIPIFTSEAGLVKRGAVAAYGADIYQWGYQAGEQASQFLKQGNLNNLHPELLKVRKRIYNPAVAQQFNITFTSPFEPLQ
ncbi:MAG: ABC transporter substrate-binding protein [Chitinophagaceae bacterium]|nr:ABC transporter substrate-binding protein [Chitinophagaceae bacterium]